MVKHLLGHFSVAKSVLSPPEQQYEDIFWAGAKGTYKEIRGDNGSMEDLEVRTEMGVGREGEKEGGGGSRRPEESGLVNNAAALA